MVESEQRRRATERATGGEACAPWQDQVVEAAGTAARAAMTEGRPVLIADLADDPRTTASALRAQGLAEAVAAVPMAAGDQVIGVLLVVRAHGNGTFDPVDLEMIDAYATQAGLALRLAEARRDSERLPSVEDRDHIAEDLHHRIIQRLFALGLSLQAIAPRIANPAIAQRSTRRSPRSTRSSGTSAAWSSS